MIVYLFFFKQKTAYEMRISDWSSDVCSSDLIADESQDPEMNRSIKIIEQYSADLPELFAKLRRNAVTDELEATITLSTAHRSKGLEWDAVQLAEDYTFDPFNPENEKEPWIDEMNLLDVSCTRAMRVLEVNSTTLRSDEHTSEIQTQI